MDFEQEQELIAEIRAYVTENLPLSKIEDDELEEKIEEIVAQKISGQYCSIDQRVTIVEQVYSSIRGFGLLDSIIKDDTITEVMINGPENVFIEQNGRLFKLDKQFESQRRLEDARADVYAYENMLADGVSLMFLEPANSKNDEKHLDVEDVVEKYDFDSILILKNRPLYSYLISHSEKYDCSFEDYEVCYFKVLRQQKD